MDIRKPDLNAPRAKQDMGYRPVNRSFWRKFKRETGMKCSYIEFSNVIKTANEVIAESAVKERDGFKLMNDIGLLLILGIKPVKDAIDYSRGSKEGVRVKHLNLETDGKMCKIVYSTYSVKDMFLNRKLWMFDAVRTFKHEASAAFKDNHNFYRTVYGFEKSSQIVNSEKRFVKQIEDAE